MFGSQSILLFNRYFYCYVYFFSFLLFLLMLLILYTHLTLFQIQHHFNYCVHCSKRNHLTAFARLWLINLWLYHIYTSFRIWSYETYLVQRVQTDRRSRELSFTYSYNLLIVEMCIVGASHVGSISNWSNFDKGHLRENQIMCATNGRITQYHNNFNNSFMTVEFDFLFTI